MYLGVHRIQKIYPVVFLQVTGLFYNFFQLALHALLVNFYRHWGSCLHSLAHPTKVLSHLNIFYQSKCHQKQLHLVAHFLIPKILQNIAQVHHTIVLRVVGLERLVLLL